jgi:hypothetical protein
MFAKEKMIYILILTIRVRSAEGRSHSINKNESLSVGSQAHPGLDSKDRGGSTYK